jgi:hypothetical protein
MVISISSISILAGLVILGVMAVRVVRAARRRVSPVKLPVRIEQIRR